MNNKKRTLLISSLVLLSFTFALFQLTTLHILTNLFAFTALFINNGF